MQTPRSDRAVLRGILWRFDLHGYGQQHLLREHIRQEEPVALEEGDLGVVQSQANLFLPGYGLHGPVIEIEVAAHLLDYRLQAARTGNLHASMQFAGNTNLAVHHFRGCPNFERIGLAKVARMIIDRARRVTLVQTQLMQRQFFDIEEHTGNLRERKVIIRCTRAMSRKQPSVLSTRAQPGDAQIDAVIPKLPIRAGSHFPKTRLSRTWLLVYWLGGSFCAETRGPGSSF